MFVLFWNFFWNNWCINQLRTMGESVLRETTTSAICLRDVRGISHPLSYIVPRWTMIIATTPTCGIEPQPLYWGHEPYPPSHACSAETDVFFNWWYIDWLRKSKKEKKSVTVVKSHGHILYRPPVSQSWGPVAGRPRNKAGITECRVLVGENRPHIRFAAEQFVSFFLFFSY